MGDAGGMLLVVCVNECLSFCLVIQLREKSPPRADPKVVDGSEK